MSGVGVPCVKRGVFVFVMRLRGDDERGEGRGGRERDIPPLHSSSTRTGSGSTTFTTKQMAARTVIGTPRY